MELQATTTNIQTLEVAKEYLAVTTQAGIVQTTVVAQCNIHIVIIVMEHTISQPTTTVLTMTSTAALPAMDVLLITTVIHVMVVHSIPLIQETVLHLVLMMAHVQATSHTDVI